MGWVTLGVRFQICVDEVTDATGDVSFFFFSSSLFPREIISQLVVLFRFFGSGGEDGGVIIWIGMGCCEELELG